MSELLPGLHAAPNIHPLFVHIPLALWLTSFLFWAFGVVADRDDVFRAGRWLAYLAVLGALAAAGTGLWAEASLGHDSPGHDAVHVHRNWMIVASSLGLVTALLAFATRRQRGRGIRGVLTSLMGLTALVSTLGADRGAALIFRDGIGAPECPAMAPASQETEGRHSH